MNWCRRSRLTPNTWLIKAYGREQINTEAELKEQKLKAEIALKESQGELHRLRTAIAAGEYISIEEARADYTKFLQY